VIFAWDVGCIELPFVSSWSMDRPVSGSTHRRFHLPQEYAVHPNVGSNTDDVIVHEVAFTNGLLAWGIERLVVGSSGRGWRWL
jgi:hypothetical protein